MIILLTLVLMSFPSFGKDFLFVLKCVSEDKKSSPNPFYFIGIEGKYSQIIYLKSIGKIFTYEGGESKNLELKSKSIDFYEYLYDQPETPNKKKSVSLFSLDRKSLVLSEGYDRDSKNPLHINFSCSKETDEEKSYRDAMNLKTKYESGGYNKI